MSNNGRPLVLYFGAAKRTEYYTGLLDSDVALGLLLDSESSYRLEPPEFALIERMPFSAGAAAVAERISTIKLHHTIESIINVDEGQVVLWAEVCARLGFPAMSPAAAANSRSKAIMRQRFAERLGVHTSAASLAATGEADAVRFAETIGYPVIVKPANLWGSFFVTRCEDRDALVRAYRHVSEALPAFSEKERIRDAPAVALVEEYLVGTNHSVECVMLDGRVWTTPVIDVVTGTDMGGADFHHFARTTATQLDPDQQRAMRGLAQDAVRALDIDRGLAHVEFVQSRTGPRLIEIGGRPGANRPTLLRDAFGINLMAGYRDVLRGRAPQLEPTRHGAAAVITPFPEHAGVLTGYRHLDRIRALRSTAELHVFSNPGSLVKTRHAGADPHLRIELRSDSPAQLAEDLQLIQELSKTLFVVDTGNKELQHA